MVDVIAGPVKVTIKGSLGVAATLAVGFFFTASLVIVMTLASTVSATQAVVAFLRLRNRAPGSRSVVRLRQVIVRWHACTCVLCAICAVLLVGVAPAHPLRVFTVYLAGLIYSFAAYRQTRAATLGGRRGHAGITPPAVRRFLGFLPGAPWLRLVTFKSRADRPVISGLLIIGFLILAGSAADATPGIGVWLHEILDGDFGRDTGLPSAKPTPGPTPTLTPTPTATLTPTPTAEVTRQFTG